MPDQVWVEFHFQDAECTMKATGKNFVTVSITFLLFLQFSAHGGHMKLILGFTLLAASDFISIYKKKVIVSKMCSPS